MRLLTSNIKDISAFPEGDNLFKWVGTIVGADGTVSLAFMLVQYSYIITCIWINNLLI